MDLVLLAIGFTGPWKHGLLEESRLEVDSRGNLVANTRDYRTNIEGVWAVGDARRGASLIVWAIREGRDAAADIDQWLMAENLARSA